MSKYNRLPDQSLNRFNFFSRQSSVSFDSSQWDAHDVMKNDFFFFHSESGCNVSWIANCNSRWGPSVKRPILQAWEGTSLQRYTLPVFPGHIHCTWEYFRTPIKPKAWGDGSSGSVDTLPEGYGAANYLHIYLHCAAFNCSLIRNADQSSIKRSYAQTTTLFLFDSVSIPLCQSDPAPRGTKNSIVGVTQQGKAAALDSGWLPRQ